MDPGLIQQWDAMILPLAHTIDTRCLRIREYTPRFENVVSDVHNEMVTQAFA